MAAIIMFRFLKIILNYREKCWGKSRARKKKKKKPTLENSDNSDQCVKNGCISELRSPERMRTCYHKEGWPIIRLAPSPGSERDMR